MIFRRRHLIIFAAIIMASDSVPVEPQQQKPVLYVIGTSHLDSQWNWTVQDTIREFVPNTFFQNFKRFEKYPDYTFNYEGAIHYMWFKEYHPEAWPTLKKYVAEGRWKVAGSWINAVDTNVPSPESLMRQALYGKRFFRQEFGKVSQDVYLPDCFGFSFALPAIATHCGLTQFSTQKLTWGSSYGIPFPLGRWKGSDGSSLVAALNPGDYVTKIRSDISVDPKWAVERMTSAGKRQIGFRYFGTGDIGGAPDEESIDWLEKSIKNKAGLAEIRNTSSDQLARDLTTEEKDALPEYEGELTMKTHGVGCYTSQAAMKRFNRENEFLGQAAEQTAVAAELLTGLRYPRERLRQAWIRMLWHQFHDDLTGTSIPQAYQFSWNDELVSANQFAGVLTNSVAAVASKMDTRGEGIPLIVYNPLAWGNDAPVEATVKFNGSAPATIRVVAAASKENQPAQVLERTGDTARILFLAHAGPTSFQVFRVAAGADAPSSSPYAYATKSLNVSESSLENIFYKVQIDKNGDIASIYDKLRSRELLKGPVRLELRDDPSPDKPAWRILWDTVNSAPREYVQAPEIRVVERGPVRVAIEINRKAAGSTFRQRVMLSLRGQRVEIENFVDWKSPNSLLKVSFPFTASNSKATYDLGLGIIQRGNNTPDHYEVPAQQWADITDQNGMFGAAVLNDSKYGWDKPADNVLRLTLLHTAKARAYPYQSSNDLGQHHFTYAIAGHFGDWRSIGKGENLTANTRYGTPVPANAAALNQPLIVFQTEAHAGPLGRSIGAVGLTNNEGQVAIRALKKAEDDDLYVLRLQELEGRPADKYIRFMLPLKFPIQSVKEITAAEESVPRGADLKFMPDGLQISLKPYQSRTLAIRFRNTLSSTGLEGPGRPLNARLNMEAEPLALPFNLDGVSTDANRGDGNFDGKGQTLAGELLPASLTVHGVPFNFGSNSAGALNVLVPNGQALPLPAGNYNRVYMVAAAAGDDVTTNIAGEPLTIREWQGPVGQWDSRLKEPRQLREVSVAPMTPGQTWSADAINQDLVVQYDAATGVVKGIDQIRRGFVKRDEIAWVGTHRHDASGNQPYIGSYLFLYSIDLPAGTRELRLPNDNRIRIMAITLAREPFHLWPATTLYSADLLTS
jgi:alpha-mannosidase